MMVAKVHGTGVHAPYESKNEENIVACIGWVVLVGACVWTGRECGAREVGAQFWVERDRVPAGWQAFSDHIGRYALCPRAQAILARPNAKNEGDGIEYIDHLRLLEPARTNARQI